MKCDKCGYSDNGSGDWAHACGPVAIQRQPVANERIRLLAKQAEQYALDKANEGNDEDYDYSFDDDFQEKFAELLIRQCINVCEPVFLDEPYEDMSEFGKGLVEGQDVAVEKIKRHFGVEE